MQRRSANMDYGTYREIMGELLRPIASAGLDDDTLLRLYESKLVYLENLRQTCFFEINSNPKTLFTGTDQQLILAAIKETKLHVRDMVMLVIVSNIAKSKAS